MSSKENAAINQLFERLECRYALRVLWALKDGHPQTFRLLQDSVGGITPNTLNTRIKELREAGFVDHGSDGYTVTPSGADLLQKTLPPNSPPPRPTQRKAPPDLRAGLSLKWGSKMLLALNHQAPIALFLIANKEFHPWH